MPQVATPTDTAGTAVGRDSNKRTAIGGIDLDNRSTTVGQLAHGGTQSDAVGVMHAIIDNLDSVATPASYGTFNLVSRTTANATIPQSDTVLGLYVYNLGNNHQPLISGHHASGWFCENTFYQAGNTLTETQWRVYLSNATQTRPFGMYTNVSTGATDTLLQADSFTLSSTGVAYDSQVAWMTFTKNNASSGIGLITAANARVDFLVPANNGQLRVGQDGNHNGFITWVYNAAPTSSNTELWIGTWNGAPVKIQPGNTGNVEIAASGGKVGFLGATPVVRQTAAAAATDLASAITLVNDLRADLISFGLFSA
jgi:hypothetical protein